jgi:glycosyltransferase involved in cell wall biosynthesis
MTINEHRSLMNVNYPNLSYFSRRLALSLRIQNYFTSKAVHKADALFCQAKFIIPKVISMYNLKRRPNFLPNPVSVPKKKPVKKAGEPTVCFIARWDPVKRPEIFFELAKRFPNVRFIAIGKAHNEKRDGYLRKRCDDIPNLTCPGFVSEEEKSKILERSWIYANTSIRECLPVAFLEALAHKCAILSSENPDDLAENFGYRVSESSLMGYIKGLEGLLKDDLWKEKGEKGFQYVKQVHEMDNVIDQYIDIYNKMLSVVKV